MVSISTYTLAEVVYISIASYILWTIYSIIVCIRTWIEGKTYIGFLLSACSGLVVFLINQTSVRLATMGAIDGLIIGGIVYELWWIIYGREKNA